MVCVLLFSLIFWGIFPCRFTFVCKFYDTERRQMEFHCGVINVTSFVKATNALHFH